MRAVPSLGAMEEVSQDFEDQEEGEHSPTPALTLGGTGGTQELAGLALLTVRALVHVSKSVARHYTDRVHMHACGSQ
jgi:hypothetical protein